MYEKESDCGPADIFRIYSSDYHIPAVCHCIDCTKPTFDSDRVFRVYEGKARGIMDRISVRTVYGLINGRADGY